MPKAQPPSLRDIVLRETAEWSDARKGRRLITAMEGEDEIELQAAWLEATDPHVEHEA